VTTVSEDTVLLTVMSEIMKLVSLAETGKLQMQNSADRAMAHSTLAGSSRWVARMHANTIPGMQAHGHRIYELGVRALRCRPIKASRSIVYTPPPLALGKRRITKKRARLSVCDMSPERD